MERKRGKRRADGRDQALAQAMGVRPILKDHDPFLRSFPWVAKGPSRVSRGRVPGRAEDYLGSLRANDFLGAGSMDNRREKNSVLD